MLDLLCVALTVAFFGMAIGLMLACESLEEEE